MSRWQGQAPNPRSFFTEKRPSFVDLRITRNVVSPEIKLTDEVGAAEDHPRDAKTGLQVTQETGAAAGRLRERD